LPLPLLLLLGGRVAPVAAVAACKTKQ
jgi:hypothetical protein